MHPFIPELLAPAGSLEKLKLALSYGADAVYLGGQQFGLRAAAENFTDGELEEATDFAHQRGKKVYTVLNGMLFDRDLEQLPPFLDLLNRCSIDALIISDPGVLAYARQMTSIDLHVSTQASVLNSQAASVWKSWGAKRIVLGREVDIETAGQIGQKSGVEIEMFVHGSMCMAYSGHCVISNYTQGRDSNRGGCAHSCRFEYTLTDGNKNSSTSYFMSSKDLMGLRQLPQYCRAGIHSLKIEGRNKGPVYAATVTRAYRLALDYLAQNPHILSVSNSELAADMAYQHHIDSILSELNLISHREYTDLPLIGDLGPSTVYDKREAEEKQSDIIGVVLGQENGGAYVEIRSAVHTSDSLELLSWGQQSSQFSALLMQNAYGQKIEHCGPGKVVFFPQLNNAFPQQIIRRRGEREC